MALFGDLPLPATTFPPRWRIPLSKPSLGAAETSAVLDTLRSGQITQGPRVAEFENQFAARLGVAHAIACSSGTTALHLVLVSLGIGPGDEVIVPDLTFVATVNSVLYCGATPVLVDVESDTWGLDVRKVEAAITPRTRAVIAVHLYGRACDTTGLDFVCTTNNIPLIEDAAEGLGGMCGNHVNAADRITHQGTASLAGTFSFYGNKVMTTGEGGMVVTNNDELANNLRSCRGHCVDRNVHPYYHTHLGFNYRLTDLAASIGIAQLSALDENLRLRRLIIEQYHRGLGHTVKDPCAAEHAAPWLYTCELPWYVNRDALASRLAFVGIETRPVFMPMHSLSHVVAAGAIGSHGGKFPVASHLSHQGISLPTYPDLPETSVDQIIGCVLAEIDRQSRKGRHS